MVYGVGYPKWGKSTVRILIVRLSAHGDVVQTLPLLNTLRQLHPQAHIGWLIEPAAAPLLQGHPQLTALHTLPLKAIKQAIKQGRLGYAWQLLNTTLSGVRDGKYEISLDVQGLAKSALVPWLAGIPHRVGYARTREWANLWYTQTRPHHQLKNPHRQTVDWFCDLAHATLTHPGTLPPAAYVLPPVAALHPWHDAAVFKTINPVVALAPGTMWPSKQWPHWRLLLQALAAHPVVLLGTHKEGEQLKQWWPNTPWPAHWLDLTGQTDWPQLMALMPHIDVLIGPDSAPMHLANATGHSTGKGPRIIGLFGPTAPGRTGPIGQGHISLTTPTPLDCMPCFKKHCPLQHHACLTQLNVAQVVQALNTIGVAV
jgi:heptosyltransferase I